MNNSLLILILSFALVAVNAQDCEEIMEYVKTNSNGTIYNSYDSDAISRVTFYDATIDFQYYYFAIVCFKQEYSYGCNEYIYQVASDTKFNYSMDYMDSAGKAFWNYIEPYSENLNCSPNFD